MYKFAKYNATELALAYVTANVKAADPETFLREMKKAEREFHKLLQQSAPPL